MSKVIILNGPPGCGKDTVGNQFAANIGFETMSFKYPLFRIAAAQMRMEYHDFTQCYEDREWKETPMDILNGHTVREYLIHISEVYIKPFFGDAWFGREALKGINSRPWCSGFVFTDGGFQSELEAIAEQHEVILIHMYRDGCDFSNDSRNYVLTNSVPRIYTLNNNGTVEEAVSQLERILDEIYDRTNEPVDERELLTGDAVPVERHITRSRARSIAGNYGIPAFLRGTEPAPAAEEPEPENTGEWNIAEAEEQFAADYASGGETLQQYTARHSENVYQQFDEQLAREGLVPADGRIWTPSHAFDTNHRTTISSVSLDELNSMSPSRPGQAV